MRKIREVLRLKWDRKLSNRETAKSCSMGRATVRDYLWRASRAGLTWPLPDELDDSKLEMLLFPPESNSCRKRPLPDFASIHKEVKRKGVTLLLLWQEYKGEHPDGYQYAQFCLLYRKWAGAIDPVMRQQHKAGEKLFIDYAGQTIWVKDSTDGTLREAQPF